MPPDTALERSLVCTGSPPHESGPHLIPESDTSTQVHSLPCVQLIASRGADHSGDPDMFVLHHFAVRSLAGGAERNLLNSSQVQPDAEREHALVVSRFRAGMGAF